MTDDRRSAHSLLEPRPLYLQARDILLNRIVENRWKPGQYLPSETELSDELGVSIGTVRKATEDLVTKGLLERLHGRGTRVATHSSAQVRFRFMRLVYPNGQPFRPVGRVLKEFRARPSKEEQLLLDIPASEETLVLLRERREQGKVLVYERIVLPQKMFENLRLHTNAELEEDLYVLYQEQCGITIMRTRDRITYEAAAPDTARALGVKSGAELLKVFRIAFSIQGKPSELRQSWTATLCYQIELE